MIKIKNKPLLQNILMVNIHAFLVTTFCSLYGVFIADKAFEARELLWLYPLGLVIGVCNIIKYEVSKRKSNFQKSLEDLAELKASQDSNVPLTSRRRAELRKLKLLQNTHSNPKAKNY